MFSGLAAVPTPSICTLLFFRLAAKALSKIINCCRAASIALTWITFLLVSGMFARAQSVDSSTLTGTPPSVGFSGGDKDLINLNSRSVHVEIPIFSTTIRGHVYTWRYVYDTPIYELRFFATPTEDNRDSGTWVVEAPNDAGSGHWTLKSDMQPVAVTSDIEGTSTNVSCHDQNGKAYTTPGTWHHAYQLTDASGTSHPLPLATLITGANPLECLIPRSVRHGYTADGSGYFVDLDAKTIRSPTGSLYTSTAPGLLATLMFTGGFTDSNGNAAPNISYVTPSASGSTPASLSIYDPMGNSQSIGLQYTAVPIQTALCSDTTIHRSPINTCTDYTGSLGTLSRITLPDGTYYEFTYTQDGMASLHTMRLPTGGIVTYSYDSAINSTRTTPRFGPVFAHSQISSRSVDDLTTTATWLYSNPDIDSLQVATQVQSPSGDCDLHYSGVGTVNTALYSPVETDVVKQAGCGVSAVVLDTIHTDYDVDIGSDPSIGITVPTYAANARPRRVTHTLKNSLSSKVETDYNSITQGGSTIYLGPREVRTYDFGATTPRTVVDYTYLHEVGSTSAPAASYLAANIISRVASVAEYDGADLNTPIAKTVYEYDNYTEALTGRSDAAWHDDNYSTNYSLRGNVTAISQWYSNSVDPLVTRNQYDVLGNVVKTTDPKGKSTLYHFDDAFADNACSPQTGQTYSFNTKRIDPVGDETDRVVASCTGSIRKSIDPNDLQASRTGTVYSYDSLSRVSLIELPTGGSASITVSPTVPISSTVTQSASPTTTYSYDGLGRVTEKQTASVCTGGTSSHSKTSYDLMGRVSSTTSPYCSTADVTYGLTENSYDPLGRVSQVLEPGGMSRYFCYDGWSPLTSVTCSAAATNGQTTESFDENGYSTWRVTDALSHLIEVDEDHKGLNLQTLYAFNARGDLTGVNQKGNPGVDTPISRIFSYDMLSRLVTSSNPETGSTCYGSWSGGAVGSGTCQNGYDGNGNLVQRTDGRGVVSTSTYDDVNRLVAKTYSGLDDAAIAIASATPPLAMKYGLPGATQPNSIGRMISSTTGPTDSPITGTYILSYDAAGNATEKKECVGASQCINPPYNQHSTYDLAGHIHTMDNGLSSPSIGLTYDYDLAGRLQDVKSTMIDDTHPEKLFGPPAAGDQYGPIGLIAAGLGVRNGSSEASVLQSRSYDNHLRLVSETDTGSALSSPGSASSGTINVTGSERQTGQGATPGVGFIEFVGSRPVGEVRVCNLDGVCTSPGGTGPGAGTISVTIWDPNSNKTFTAYVDYDGEDPGTLAQELVDQLNMTDGDGNPPLVSATVGDCGGTHLNGCLALNMTALAPGSTSNYTFVVTITNPDDYSFGVSGNAFTGGSDGSATTYDAGFISVGVNGGSCSGTSSSTCAVATWQQGSNLASISGQLVTQLQSLGFSVLTTISGQTLQLSLTNSAVGTVGNWTLSCTASDTANQTASFGVSCAGMQGGTDSGAASSSTLYAYSIPDGGFDPSGRLKEVDDTVMGHWRYEYDSLSRLQTGNASASSQTGLAPYSAAQLIWSYDDFGNFEGQQLSGTTQATIIQSNFTYTGHSLLNGAPRNGTNNNQIDGYNYDSAGNLSADGANSFTYDAENRIASVNGTTSYLYNAFGERVAKLSGVGPNAPVEKIYVTGGGGFAVSELNSNGQWINSSVSLSGSQRAVYDSVGVHFELTDWLGTRRAQAGATGRSEEICESLPFGDSLQCVAPGGGVVAVGQSPEAGDTHLTGKERDPESGLDYFGARHYGSSLGRFMSPDPSGLLAQRPQDPQSWNLYTYATNNPLSFTDPTGLDCVYTEGDQLESVDHESSSDECGNSQGTWVPGYVDENWVHYNTITDLFQVGSLDGAGEDATVDYTMFAPGARTTFNADQSACLSGCTRFSLENANWLQEQLVGNGIGSGLEGYIGFLVSRDKPVSKVSSYLYGPLDASTDHWAGPGGAGPPGGQGDWAASVHDYNFATNGPRGYHKNKKGDMVGIEISMYWNPFIPRRTARALIQADRMLYSHAGGYEGIKMGLFFGVLVNTPQAIVHGTL